MGESLFPGDPEGTSSEALRSEAESDPTESGAADSPVVEPQDEVTAINTPETSDDVKEKNARIAEIAIRLLINCKSLKLDAPVQNTIDAATSLIAKISSEGAWGKGSREVVLQAIGQIKNRLDEWIDADQSVPSKAALQMGWQLGANITLARAELDKLQVD